MSARSSFLLLACFLVACAAPAKPAEPVDPHAGHHMESSKPSKTFEAEDYTDGEQIVFRVTENDTVFENYGINHTKQMHVIVVRDDLRDFHHLHPFRDSESTWSVPFTPSKGGNYWIYADFVEEDGTPHVLRIEHTYSGEVNNIGVIKSPDLRKSTGAYDVHFQTIRAGAGTELRYTITDQQGNFAQLENYLGAKGHVVLLSETGEYIHVHPHTEYIGYKEEDPPVFFTEHLNVSTFYRAFSQFQIDGVVHTIEFDIDSKT